MLPESPLVALYDHSAVLTGACWDFLDPVVRTLSHQFSAIRVNVPASLVAGECWGSGDEPSFQAPEQQGLTSQVLPLYETWTYRLNAHRSAPTVMESPTIVFQAIALRVLRR